MAKRQDSGSNPAHQNQRPTSHDEDAGPHHYSRQEQEPEDVDLIVDQRSRSQNGKNDDSPNSPETAHATSLCDNVNDPCVDAGLRVP